MRIIHLSDIHFDDTQKEFQNYYTKALIKDLIKLNKEKKIDLITIAGDLIDKGGQSYVDKDKIYEIFREKFINYLKENLKLEDNQFIFVAGNHDIDESIIDEFYENGILSTLTNIEKINDFQVKNTDKDHETIIRLKRYKDFEKNFHKSNKDYHITNFESYTVKRFDDINVGFACLNSAWRCSTSLPKDKLLLGTQQIINANYYFDANNCDFVIGLIHHPIEMFSEIERKEISNLLQTQHFDVILAGHTHSSESYHLIGNNGNIFFNVARSAFNNPREKISKFNSGYSVLDIDLKNLVVDCQFRKYYYQRNEYDLDLDCNSNGRFREKLKPKKDKEEFHKLLDLTNKSCNAKADNINTSLVIYGTDSIAPRDLNQIFVLPKLTESPMVMGSLNENSKQFSIDDLIINEKNIVLIGDKETGKSTLLNKIYLEASNRFSRFQLIPVLVNYKELLKKEIKPLIKDFLNEPSSDEIEELLNQGKILVLLDDYVEKEKYIYAKSKLNKFLNVYNKNKLIIASSCNIEILLTSTDSILKPIDKESKKKEFKSVFIGQVGVKEFKELTYKWFKTKDAEWLHLNIGKLIKVFEILRIPRTFFSISLFLWIIEKQENFKPINKSNLVSRFLNYILEGLNLENVIAGSYDYDKKIEILTEISYEMYRNGDQNNNYALTEVELVNCIQKNFDLNQLKRLSAVEKMQEFIDKGILQRNEQENTIRFRYEAFFQYFLSLNIDNIPKFKKEVFSEDQFIEFIDEIDYYTGRKRDDIKTLEIVIERLKISFEEIEKLIKASIDEYFPTESFFLKHINSKEFANELQDKKLSNEEIEEALGKQLDILPVDDSIRIKKSAEYRMYFNKVLELAARVLKNSENIKNPKLINESLDLIIHKSALYGIIIQSVMIDSFENNGFDEFPIPPEMVISIAPIINQVLLLTWLGTDFLEYPIENKLKGLLKNIEVSEYELYLTGFLYADMKFKDYIKYLNGIVDKLTNKFILELCFLKILLVYLFKPEGSSILPSLEKMLKKILIKARNLSKREAKHFVENKLREKKKEVHKQLSIDF